MEEDFQTSQRSSSFDVPTVDVKAAIAASNLVAMSDVDIIAALVVARRPVVIKRN